MTATSFRCMLAKDAKPENLRFPLIVQAKLDGIRLSIVGGKPVTRTLKDVPNAEVREYLSRAEFEGLDGEVIVGDPTAEDCYRKTVSFVMSHDKVGEDWSFYVFDKWDSEHPFKSRTVEVSSYLAMLNWDAGIEASRLKYLGGDEVADEEALEEAESLIVAEGHEGAILRDPEGLYKFGRSGIKGPLLKLKRFVDFEAEVIGVFEEMHNGNEATTNALGRTERSSHKENKVGKGTLGGLYVRALNGLDEGVEFKVGTGFDAAQRADLWARANDYAVMSTAIDVVDSGPAGLNGLVAKVKSFPIGAKDKPRHPVFLGFRDLEVDG